MILNKRQKRTLLFAAIALTVGWSTSAALRFAVFPSLLPAILLLIAVIFSNRDHLKHSFGTTLVAGLLPVFPLYLFGPFSLFGISLTLTYAVIFYALGFALVILMIRWTQYGIVLKAPQLVFTGCLILLHSLLLKIIFSGPDDVFYLSKIPDIQLLVCQVFIALSVIHTMQPLTTESKGAPVNSPGPNPKRPGSLGRDIALTVGVVFISFALAFIALLIGLSSWGADDEGCRSPDRYTIFKSKAAHYRPEVIYDTRKYTRLRDFITRNRDTLFAFDDGKKHLSIRMNAEGRSDTSIYTSDCISFFDYGPGNRIRDQVPPHLYPELTRIYKAFTARNFYSVSFCRDGSITISISNPSEYNDKGIGVNHRLEWRSAKSYEQVMPDTSSLSRDTTLANGARYTIFIDCYRGR